MIDAVGVPQHVVLFGGASEIALAIAERYAARGTARVTLLARPGATREAAAARLDRQGLDVAVVDFDALDVDSHRAALAAVAGDIDLAVVAFGVLGDQEAAWQDLDAALEMVRVNYVAAVSVGVLLAERLRAQGHGVIAALSSVAGERVRRSNFVYGSTKAGMDGFYLGLGEALRDAGVRVLVVRPGFVHSKMTEGLDAAPLSVTPEQVADAVVEGVSAGREVIWVPKPMRPVMSVLRHVPRPVFRRLPL